MLLLSLVVYTGCFVLCAFEDDPRQSTMADSCRHHNHFFVEDTAGDRGTLGTKHAKSYSSRCTRYVTTRRSCTATGKTMGRCGGRVSAGTGGPALPLEQRGHQWQHRFILCFPPSVGISGRKTGRKTRKEKIRERASLLSEIKRACMKMFEGGFDGAI